MAAYALFIAALIAIGAWQRYGAPYYVGVAVAAMLCASHYRFIRERTREGCFKAFRANNWVGAAVFAGIVLDNPPFTAWLQRLFA
jgi:4-hydroxybenzoate polyprenyltransferase